MGVAVAVNRTAPRKRRAHAQMPPPGIHQPEDVRAWLAAIVDSSGDSIVSKDLSGIVTSWNKAAEHLFGYAATEMIGQPITTIFPSDRIGEEAAILARIGRGEEVDRYETIRRHKEGRAVKVSATVSPIKDVNGNVIGASTIIRDLTEREAQDRRVRELQAELAHVQRLTELGRIVSMLVHEVNQPLTAMDNYINACHRLLTSGKHEQVQSALTQLANQTDRARQIVQRIREFVKKGESRMRAEHLPQIIEEIINLTETSVADIGPGLPDEVRSKLFQPFITTKPNGMGIGLSVCRDIVETHGGRLWAEDNPGGGTVFRFTVRGAAQKEAAPSIAE